MGKHEITIATDMTLAAASPHMSLHVPPPPPPTNMYPHAEVPAIIAHSGGKGSVHRLTSSVFHKTLRIAQDGHDCGPRIAHFTFPPHNALVLVHMLFSKRVTMFGASTVRMDGLPAGVIDMLQGCPMLMCADPISLPIQEAPSNATNTVYIGTTSSDMSGGWRGLLMRMLIEAVIYRFAKWLVHQIHLDKALKPLERALRAILKLFTKHFLKWLIPKSPEQGAADTTTAVLTTSSPFGDATINLSQNDDGSFSADTTSPSSSGRRGQQRFAGLGVLRSADEERDERPDELDALFQHAPAL